MSVKIDVGDTINKAIGASTRFGEFWRGMTFPDSIGPAVGFLIVLGVLPLLGSILAGLIPQFWWGFWIWRPITGIIWGVFFYAYFIVAPLLMGALMGAMDKPLEINKAGANEYTTIVAYSMSPWAIGALLQFIPFVGFFFMPLFGIWSLVVLYLGLAVGLKMDAGKAIILIIVCGLIAGVIIGIVFGLVFALTFWMPL